jgi:hypothetical protein
MVGTTESHSRHMEPQTIIAVLAAAAIAGGFVGLIANLARRDREESRLKEHLKERSGLLEKRISIHRRRKERLRDLRAVLEARKGGKLPAGEDPGLARDLALESPPSTAGAPTGPVAEKKPALQAKISQTAKDHPEETVAALRLMIKRDNP